MCRFWQALFICLLVPFLYAHSIESTDFIDYAKYSLAGDQEYRAGRYENALAKYQTAIRIAENNSCISGRAQSMRKSALCLWNLGDIDASQKAYSEAQSIAVEIGFAEEAQINSCNIKIIEYYKQGKEHRAKMEHKASLLSFDKAIELSRQISSEAHEAKCLRQKGITHWEAGELYEFRKDNELALALAKKINNRREEVRCLNNLGLYYLEVEDSFQALKFFEDGLTITQKANDRKEEASISSNLGAAYLHLGNNKKALEYFEQSKAINARSGDIKGLAIDYINIGVAFRNQGAIKEDNTLLNSALLNLRHSYCLTSNIRLETIILNNIGFVLLNLKEYSKALSHFSSALKKAMKLNNVSMISHIHANIGHVFNNLGLYDKAIISFNGAINEAIKTNSKRLLWEAYLGLGQAWELKGNNILAESFYWKSIDCVEYMRSRVFGDEFKVSFLDSKVVAHEKLVGFLYRKDKRKSNHEVCRKIFNVIERAKGRAILDVLSTHDKENEIDPVLLERRDDLANMISVIISKLKSNNHQKPKLMNLNERLRQYEDKIARINAMIDEAKSAATKNPPVMPYELDEIRRRLLDDETALIEYFLGDKASYLLFLTKANQYIFELPSRSAIEASVKAFVSLLSSRDSDEHIGEAAARRIFRELLFPLEMDYSCGLKRLIVIPDGQLCRLPFEALAVDDIRVSFPAAYLINRYQISYASSASSLVSLQERSLYHERQHTKDFLGIGDPDCYSNMQKEVILHSAHRVASREYFLSQGISFSKLPYAKKEVQEIASLFPFKKRKILVNADCTEETIKKMNLQIYRILHFACHGFIDEEEPQRSALVLALNHDKEEDGFLQAREIVALKLNAELVVLSACRTARGSLKRGEGVLDLSRSFYQAGAKSVLASLWIIDDKAAAEMMKEFYVELVRGSAFAEALRRAKLRMIKRGVTDPFYWAGFVISGDGLSSLQKGY